MVIYLSSITSIDTTLYEAAAIDGGSHWQQTKYITIPCMKPIIIIMFILNVGRIFYSEYSILYFRYIYLQQFTVKHANRKDYCSFIFPVSSMLYYYSGS